MDAIQKTRSYLSDLLDKYPTLRAASNRVLYVDFTLWKIKTHKRDYPNEFNDSKVCWVSPKTIGYVSLRKFNMAQNEKQTIKVMPGNWDLLRKKIERSNEYQELKTKLSFTKTTGNIGYPEFLRVVFQNRMRFADDIEFQKTEAEITVNVGRHGDLLLNNGIRILTAAKLLRVDSIPVRIVARHCEWQKLRKELYTQSLSENKRFALYQPLTHPDLRGMKTEHPSEDRYNIIRENISSQSGKLLDIGSNYGYFCHKFEESGFECYAVENNLVGSYYLKKLKRAENRRFTVINQSIFDWNGVKAIEFDVVLALNVLHHFLKKKTSYTKLVELLKNLRLKEMFFQPHVFTEPQMKNAYINYSGKDFVDFILQSTQLGRAELVGTSHDGRPIYKLH